MLRWSHLFMDWLTHDIWFATHKVCFTVPAPISALTVIHAKTMFFILMDRVKYVL
jgi:hypothetical protein